MSTPNQIPCLSLLLSHTRGKDVKTNEVTSANEVIPPGVKLIGAPALWKEEITGRGVKVGVIDTGIDRNHPDLRKNVVIARDYVKDKKPMTQWHYHGTHVAGTIAANGYLKGVAPEAKLADYRVLDTNGSGTSEAVTEAILQAVADGCNIINLSLGSLNDYPPMLDAVKYAISKNVMVVAAVGNEGDNSPVTDEFSYPGCYNEVVGAASVGFDANGKLKNSYFSNSNPQVDVAALGENVISCAPDEKYMVLNGTSMASPHVSGFAALLLSKAKLRARLEKIPEETLYLMVKTLTLDMDVAGIDPNTGAGLVTFDLELPQGNIKQSLEA
jgi:major intracellular serine protease